MSSFMFTTRVIPTHFRISAIFGWALGASCAASRTNTHRVQSNNTVLITCQHCSWQRSLTLTWLCKCVIIILSLNNINSCVLETRSSTRRLLSTVGFASSGVRECENWTNGRCLPCDLWHRNEPVCSLQNFCPRCCIYDMKATLHYQEGRIAR
jgi:hypothetical protein